MKKFIFLILTTLLIEKMQGQFLEKVYLKDSITVYEGWIIEQVPQDYLKMLRLKERDTITIEVGMVWKIVRVLDPKKLSAFISNETEALQAKKGYSRAFFLELFGNGALYSVNFDSRFKKGRRDGLGYRFGLGYFTYTDTISGLKQTIRLSAIPFDINYLLGKKKNALELGVGATLFSSRLNGERYNTNNPDVIGLEAFNIQSNGFIGFINIAYRYRTLNNGFMFKASFSPIIVPVFVPFFGISFGYHFQK